MKELALQYRHQEFSTGEEFSYEKELSFLKCGNDRHT